MKRLLCLAFLPFLLALSQQEAVDHVHHSALEELTCESCGASPAGVLPSQAALLPVAPSQTGATRQPAASPTAFPTHLKRSRAPPASVCC